MRSSLREWRVPVDRPVLYASVVFHLLATRAYAAPPSTDASQGGRRAEEHVHAAFVSETPAFADIRSAVVESRVPRDIRDRIDDERFAARPLLLEARGGMATLVGTVGLTASYEVGQLFAIGGAFGTNIAGPQVGGFVRVRPLVFVSQRWSRLHAVGVEAGYSTGPFRHYSIAAGDGPDGRRSSYEWSRVHWLQPEVTYETRSFGGFHVRAGMGLAIPIARSGYRCLDTRLCDLNKLGVLPSLTAAVGYAIDVSR